MVADPVENKQDTSKYAIISSQTKLKERDCVSHIAAFTMLIYHSGRQKSEPPNVWMWVTWRTESKTQFNPITLPCLFQFCKTMSLEPLLLFRLCDFCRKLGRGVREDTYIHLIWGGHVAVLAGWYRSLVQRRLFESHEHLASGFGYDRCRAFSIAMAIKMLVAQLLGARGAFTRSTVSLSCWLSFRWTKLRIGRSLLSTRSCNCDTFSSRRSFTVFPITSRTDVLLGGKSRLYIALSNVSVLAWVASSESPKHHILAKSVAAAGLSFTRTIFSKFLSSRGASNMVQSVGKGVRLDSRGMQTVAAALARITASGGTKS